MKHREILLFNIQGEFIKEFSSITEFSAFLKCKEPSVVYGTIKRFGIINKKYIAIFKDSFNIYTINNLINTNQKAIYLCLNKEGDFIKTYYNVNELTFDGFNANSVSKVSINTLNINNINKIGYTHKGFIFINYFKLSYEDKLKVIKNKLI